MKNHLYLRVIIILVAASQLLMSCDNAPPRSDKQPLQKISIAVMPHSFAGYTIFVAKEKGYFKNEGLDVTLQPFPHGKAALNALTGKKVEFSVSSETPFMHAVLNGAAISTFAVTIKAHDHLAVVARKDKDIQTAADLKGKKIGVTVGTNGEYFLETVLMLHNIQRSEIKTVHLKPKQMFDAIMNEEVDAIATWNPQMHRAKKELGDQGNIFYAQGLYSPFFLIAARKDFISSNPATIAGVVEALHKASILTNKNPGQSHIIVAPHLKTTPGVLNELSATYDFNVSLDQAFLITLENQTKWAIKNNLTHKTDIPNYLNHIYLDAVEDVTPEALTIFH